MFNIAMFGCAHLGYAPTGLRRKLTDGTNVVAADGYAAHRQTITDVCAAAGSLPGTTVLVDGGDLFHDPHPRPEAIDVALDCDALRVAAGIERFSIPGNHDRSSATATPATAVLRDAPGSHVVAPSRFGVAERAPADRRRETRADGLYEVWSFQTGAEDLGPQVHLHLINEQALAPTADDMDAAVDPRPVAAGVNILVTHGIVPDSASHYVQSDERGGNRVIPTDWFHRGFSAALLSDFHTPASDTLGGTPWAYTGSAVRRGFADAETPRGWLMCTVDDEGRIALSFNAVEQRPAIDETIDLPDDPAAAVAAVTGLLADLAGRTRDEASAKRTGVAGVRVRLRVDAPNVAVYDAASAMVAEWSRSLPDALSLQVSVTGVGQPTDLPSALDSIPDVGDETVMQAMRRMAEAGTLTGLAELSDAERAAVLDEATAALSA